MKLSFWQNLQNLLCNEWSEAMEEISYRKQSRMCGKGENSILHVSPLLRSNEMKNMRLAKINY